jgi:hypothetical protein
MDKVIDNLINETELYNFEDNHCYYHPFLWYFDGEPGYKDKDITPVTLETIKRRLYDTYTGANRYMREYLADTFGVTNERELKYIITTYIEKL